ncbi:hypothetical protein TNCV_3235301 [Trichonephila clavipes]|nr:hypothetical protein TNCV_3235301 [Trichonephila clavipes]
MSWTLSPEVSFIVAQVSAGRIRRCLEQHKLSKCRTVIATSLDTVAERRVTTVVCQTIKLDTEVIPCRLKRRVHILRAAS